MKKLFTKIVIRKIVLHKTGIIMAHGWTIIEIRIICLIWTFSGITCYSKYRYKVKESSGVTARKKESLEKSVFVYSFERDLLSEKQCLFGLLD